MDSCDICGHPPIRHIKDGHNWYCIICALMVKENIVIGGFKPTLCTQQFNFRLSQHEREQAAHADKNSYPARTVCAVCLNEWEAHMGYLCPSGDSTFLPYLDAGSEYRSN